MTAEDSAQLQQRIQVMGADLGERYHALWKHFIWLNVKWDEFERLYGHSRERVNLLNAVAPQFFGDLQGTLWRDILLHVARLVDPAQTGGRKNLTIRGLAPLIADPALAQDVSRLVDDAVQESASIKHWRNRRLAHNAP